MDSLNRRGLHENTLLALRLPFGNVVSGLGVVVIGTENVTALGGECVCRVPEPSRAGITFP